MIHFWALQPRVLHAPGAMMTVVNTNSLKLVYLLVHLYIYMCLCIYFGLLNKSSATIGVPPSGKYCLASSMPPYAEDTSWQAVFSQRALLWLRHATKTSNLKTYIRPIFAPVGGEILIDYSFDS